MKVEITKAQLIAIAEAAGSLESTLGGGGNIEDPDLDNYDKDTIHQLSLIGRFFTKNGYQNPTKY